MWRDGCPATESPLQYKPNGSGERRKELGGSRGTRGARREESGEDLTEEERGAEGGSRGYRVTKEAATPLAEGGGTAARGEGG